jgi:hypothetical protein
MEKDNVIADDIVRVMKTQDMSYVNMKRAVDAKVQQTISLLHCLAHNTPFPAHRK